MRAKTIAIFGVFVLLIATGVYLLDMFNIPPLFMGKTEIITACVVKEGLVPHGKGVTHRIDFNYQFDGIIYEGHHYTNKLQFPLIIGDSIQIAVSIKNPSNNEVVDFSIE